VGSRRAQTGPWRPGSPTESSGPPCPAKLAIASAVAQPLDGGRLLPLIIPDRLDPGRVRGRRRLVDEIGFRFRRHGDGGDVGRDALLHLAPCASAALRAASCSRSMPVLRGCPPRRRTSAPGGLPVNGKPRPLGDKVPDPSSRPLKSRRAWRHHRDAPVPEPPICRSASPPKKWTCCSAWPRRSTNVNESNSWSRSRPRLEAASAQTGVGPGLGVLHRVGRVVQRKYFDPPPLPNAGKMARA
jgi:hypothetical protein